MEPCDRPLVESAPAAHLRAAADAWRASGLAVVAVVPPRDRGAIRSALGSEVQVVPLADPDQALTDAARGVLRSDGRCVVVARRSGEGWDWLATAGSDPSAFVPTGSEPVPEPEDAAPKPPRPLVDLGQGWWFGGGLRTGYPTWATVLVSAHLGPVYLDAGRTMLVGSLWRDRWWRVGGLVPVLRLPTAVGSVGAEVGWRYRLIADLDDQRGPTGTLEAEVASRIPDMRAFEAFARVGAGVDLVFTPFRHVRGERVDPYPVMEAAFGFRVTPGRVRAADLARKGSRAPGTSRSGCRAPPTGRAAVP